ncbi:hypothetical protein B0H10DRAFT_2323646 [Mycena sp. CBHHK59/15]|nr:hypothetical protein B0H10DRAFT_2323646 [Mycena sp. CBHHK59/15]
MWTETQSSRAHIPTPMDVRHIHPTQMKVYTPKSITLGNGDICSAGDWVVWDEIIGQTLHNHIGQVVEIVQVIGSPAYQARKADFVLVMHSIVGEAHEVYKMRRVQPVPTEHQSVQAQNIWCTVNVQHNCADNKCRTTRTRVVLAEQEKTSQRELAVEHITAPAPGAGAARGTVRTTSRAWAGTGDRWRRQRRMRTARRQRWCTGVCR